MALPLLATGNDPWRLGTRMAAVCDDSVAELARPTLNNLIDSPNPRSMSAAISFLAGDGLRSDRWTAEMEDVADAGWSADSLSALLRTSDAVIRSLGDCRTQSHHRQRVMRYPY